MEKIKMGIVGLGVWGQTHASIYNEHPYAEVVAVCDKDEQALEKMKRKYPSIKETYTDYREMAEKSLCDAVAVVTPDFSHRDIACCFAEKKKHLLIEKPLATTSEDIHAIYDTVKKNNIRAMVDLHNRWNPPFNVAKQKIDSGILGDPYTAYIRHSDIKWVATDMLLWAAKSSIMWFLGSHSLDSLRWLMNDEVKRVYSVKRKGILSSLGVDTDDIFLSTIEFKKGGIAHMENGWVTPNGNMNINDFNFSVLCTKGMISANLSSHNVIQMATEEKTTTPDFLVSHYVFDRCKGLAYESIRDFIDRLIDGKPFRVSMEDAKNTALAILALLESADKGGVPIEINL